jgi:hypothetical protein
MANKKSPAAKTQITPPSRLTTKKAPFETAELNKELVAFFNQRIADDDVMRLIDCTWGVYAFFDYDDEPIYVGQSKEKVSGRIRRHLTNRRTDAVAMSVLDPFEVYSVEVWPLPELQKQLGPKPAQTEKEKLAAYNEATRQAAAFLNDLEAAVYFHCLSKSSFKAVLNEKLPVKNNDVALPRSYKGVIVNAEVQKLRDHPDTRIARRAATIARLASIISERTVKPGLRRTLDVQAKRLQQLAHERLNVFMAEVESEDRKPGSAEESEA